MASKDVDKTETEQSVNTKEEQEMAKKEEKERKKREKENKKLQKRKNKGKGKGSLIPVVFVFIIIGALVGLIVTNAFGLREKYLRTYLEKIPVVNNLLPPQEETPQDEFSNLNRDDFVAEIKKLQVELEASEQDKNDLSVKITNLNQEMIRLQEIEAAQASFRADKEEFDRLVALNDPEAYSKYYEQISPENAAQLYTEAVTTIQNDRELQDYVKTFQSMKKDAAASVLEELVRTDMNLVVMILQNISSDKRAEILGAMTPKNAANITKSMAP